ncbi:MAG: MBOAT family O-acyltransferase [Meiothermus sp.]|nr:MBOAT family O-acyltransferase [Meiothermus sp.]
MSFTSPSFFFGFFPLFLVIYWMTPARLRAYLILGASYLFYAAWQPQYALLLGLVTLVSFLVGRGVTTDNPKRNLRLLSLGVVFNLGVLGYFKYSGFGLEALKGLLGGLGLETQGWLSPTLNLALPVGLSFYVFSAISYMVDVYRKEAQPEPSPWRFAAYLSFFGYLLNGPIQRYQKTGPQFAAPQMETDLFGWGAMRFMVGFSKKVLIADSLAPLVQAAFSVPNPSMADAWLGAFAYTIQLYYDFSGYSDMAIGVAAMLGLRIPENFRHPYTAQSITEFWQRWHLSLSSFLRHYLYIPLGGNRKGDLRTYANLAITMVLGGLWHGANWTFVVWGVYNGLFLMLERYLKDRFKRPPPPIWYAVPKMLVIVVLGRILFVSDSLQDAANMYLGAFGMYGLGLSLSVSLALTPERVAVLVLGTALCYGAPHLDHLELQRYLPAVRTLVFPLFVVALLLASAHEFVPFLYFRF